MRHLLFIIFLLVLSILILAVTALILTYEDRLYPFWILITTVTGVLFVPTLKRWADEICS